MLTYPSKMGSLLILSSIFVVLIIPYSFQTSLVEVSLSNGQEYKMESIGYPGGIPANHQQQWRITAPPGTQISISCYDVRLYEANPCNDALTIDDGQKKQILCGSRYDTEFDGNGNQISATLKVGSNGGGGVSCTATVKKTSSSSLRPPQSSEQRVVLVAGGQSQWLETLGYPRRAPANSEQVWSLTTTEGSRIRITCPDIRLFQDSERNCDNEYIEITDGGYEKQICGNAFDYSYLSSGNTLRVRVLKGEHEGGGIRCEVQGRIMDWYGEATPPPTTTPPPYKGIQSEEVDSDEFGGPPGPKTTSCKCGWANKASKRIVNGVETKINEYPFIVALVNRHSRWQFCGGSIITPYHVLTAAHCTWRSVEANEPLAVIVGEHALKEENESNATELININRVIEHPDFNRVNLVNDVALLVLERRIEFNQFVGPVCMPSQGWLELARKYVTIIGWGNLKHGGSGATRLQKVHNRVTHWETCRAVFPAMRGDMKSQICTYSANKGACHGDSGGPVVWADPETNRYTLVGLVSYGTICAGNEPTVHAAVAAFIDWVEGHIRATMPHDICKKIN